MPRGVWQGQLRAFEWLMQFVTGGVRVWATVIGYAPGVKISIQRAIGCARHARFVKSGGLMRTPYSSGGERVTRVGSKAFHV